MGSASESKVKHLAMHSHGSAPPFYSECTVSAPHVALAAEQQALPKCVRSLEVAV